MISHAVFLAAQNFYKPQEEQPYFVILMVENEAKLAEFADHLSLLGIKGIIRYHEPDINNELVSIAIEPIIGEQRKIFKKLKLFDIKY